MKKVFLIVVLAVLSSASVFYSCDKANENPEPSINSVKQQTDNLINKADGDVVFKSKYGENGYSVMNIAEDEDATVIILKDAEMPDDAELITATTCLEFNEENGTYVTTIPDDGQTYWLIDFNPNSNEPVIEVNPGHTVTISCNCSSTGCCYVWKEPAPSGVGSQYSCVTFCAEPDGPGYPCQGSCDQTTVISGGGAPIYNVVIVTGETINYNGNIYEN